MNINVNIIGGSESQRAMAEGAVAHAHSFLFPRVRSLEIDVELSDIDSGEHGFCYEECDRLFVLEINENLSPAEMLTAIFHEMVHVKQYLRKELKQKHIDGLGPRMYWMGQEYLGSKYHDFPWEIEAYDLENKIMESYNN